MIAVLKRLLHFGELQMRQRVKQGEGKIRTKSDQAIRND
jgi:hypothetical protein